jgi:hypothetical protein
MKFRNIRIITSAMFALMIGSEASATPSWAGDQQTPSAPSYAQVHDQGYEAIAISQVPQRQHQAEPLLVEQAQQRQCSTCKIIGFTAGGIAIIAGLYGLYWFHCWGQVSAPCYNPFSYLLGPTGALW